MANIDGRLRPDGRAHREFTCQVDFGQHIVYEKAAQLLEDSFTLPAIYGLTPFGFGKFQVTFTSALHTANATAYGVIFNEKKIDIVPIEQRSVKLTLRNCPVELHPNVICETLSGFGKVESHEFDRDPKRGWLTGNRTVHLNMTRPVPNIIKVGVYNVIVSYPGVVLQCRRCEETGHLSSECEAVFCHRCRTYGHKAKECPRAQRKRSTSRGRTQNRVQTLSRSRGTTPSRTRTPSPTSQLLSDVLNNSLPEVSSRVESQPHNLREDHPTNKVTDNARDSKLADDLVLSMSESEAEMLTPKSDAISPLKRRKKNSTKKNAPSSNTNSAVSDQEDFPLQLNFPMLATPTDSSIECGSVVLAPQSAIHLDNTLSPTSPKPSYAQATTTVSHKKDPIRYISTPVGALSPLTKGRKKNYSKGSAAVVTKQLDFTNSTPF